MNKLRVSVAFNLFKVSFISGYLFAKREISFDVSTFGAFATFKELLLSELYGRLFLIMISASKDFTYLLMSISSVFKWILIIDNGFFESCDFHSALKCYLLSQFTVMHCELWMGSINLEYTDPRPTVSWTIPSTDQP